MVVIGIYIFISTRPTIDAFNDAGKALTLVYTIEPCAPSENACDSIRDILQQYSIEFEEINLTDETNPLKKVRAMGGGKTLPYTVIGDRSMEGFDKIELAAMVDRAYGIDILTENERRIIDSHFYADGSEKVVIYSANDCEDCQKTRAYFTTNDIPYKEVSTDDDAKGKADYKALKPSGFPLTFVGYKRINGFDETTLEQAMESD